MIGLTWLRGLLRRRGRPAGRGRGRRRRRGRAAGQPRRVPRRVQGDHDRAGGRPASPSTGRWRSQPGADPGRVLAAVARLRRGSARRCRSGSPPTTGLQATDGGHHADHRAGRGARPARRLPARRSPASCAPWPEPTPGCCSPSRPRPTCTPRPGDTVRSAGRACRRAASRVDGRRRPAAGRLAVPEGRRTARAPSRRRRRTTCCCCPPGAGTQVFDPLAARPPGPGHAPGPRPARRATCRPTRPPPTPPISGAARNLEARLAGAGAGRRQPRRRPGRGPRGRPVRPGAVPVPRAARGGPGRAAHGRGRRRRRATGGAASRRCCAPAAPPPASWSASAVVEAALVGVVGAAAGLAAAAVVGRLAFGTAGFGATARARRLGGGRGAGRAGHRRRHRRRARRGATPARPRSPRPRAVGRRRPARAGCAAGSTSSLLAALAAWCSG